MRVNADEYKRWAHQKVFFVFVGGSSELTLFIETTITTMLLQKIQGERLLDLKFSPLSRLSPIERHINQNSLVLSVAAIYNSQSTLNKPVKVALSSVSQHFTRIFQYRLRKSKRMQLVTFCWSWNSSLRFLRDHLHRNASVYNFCFKISNRKTATHFRSSFMQSVQPYLLASVCFHFPYKLPN